MKTITLLQPDDWHCHLRDHKQLNRTVLDTSARFHRAIVMPNLSEPITSLSAAAAYQQRIQASIPPGHDFKPLMTLYLTETLSRETILEAGQSDIITACKLYPAGATTRSEAGIQNIKNIYPLFEAMERVNLPLLIHAETTNPDIDIFNREIVFIEQHVADIHKTFPRLRIVIEHISSKKGVEFVQAASSTVAATITPHHLILTRNDIFKEGLDPHHYCLPIVKTAEDRAALIKAATSGNLKFFLGTDSAPHPRQKKETRKGAAGIYNTPVALEIYATIFERENALAQLEKFASRNGPLFYQLPPNSKTITLKKQKWRVPDQLTYGDDDVLPLYAGKSLDWQLILS